MDYEILNDGQPNDDGLIEAVIRNSEGRVISKYRAKTERELLEKLLQSQANANVEIARLRKPDAARPPLKVEPKELNAAERLRLSSEITDPTRIVEAVDEIITARQGISPDRLGEEFKRRSLEEQGEYYGRTANEFRADYPEYYPVPQNLQAMVNELEKQKLDWTRNNLGIVYASLKERGELIPWPENKAEAEPEANPQPNGNGTPRARTIATTGLRATDGNSLPPAPPPKRQKFTRADIERMSRQEYTERLHSDPDFRKQVDAM
jgi:hypothetical protein